MLVISCMRFIVPIPIINCKFILNLIMSTILDRIVISLFSFFACFVIYFFILLYYNLLPVFIFNRLLCARKQPFHFILSYHFLFCLLFPFLVFPKNEFYLGTTGTGWMHSIERRDMNLHFNLQMKVEPIDSVKLKLKLTICNNI